MVQIKLHKYEIADLNIKQYLSGGYKTVKNDMAMHRTDSWQFYRAQVHSPQETNKSTARSKTWRGEKTTHTHSK